MGEDDGKLLISDAIDKRLHSACQMLEQACTLAGVPPSGVLLELPPRVFDRLVGTHTRQLLLRQIKVRRGHDRG